MAKSAQSSVPTLFQTPSLTHPSVTLLPQLCNHPKLVLPPGSDEYRKAEERAGTSLDEIRHSSKLSALKQLLQDCGIGIQQEGE